MLQLLMDMAKGIAELGAAIGAGLSVLGAGFGIGKIGSSAMKLLHANPKLQAISVLT